MKVYDATLHGWYDIAWFAAGIGRVYAESELHVYGLYYVRVDGIEHGVEQYPLSAEPPPAQGEMSAVVWPNPARGRARVAFTPEAGGPVRLEVRDALGRLVHAQEVRAVPHVRMEATLDLAGLAPGVYVVRLDGAREGAATLLTVLR